jgi:hypothetical protein
MCDAQHTSSIRPSWISNARKGRRAQHCASTFWHGIFRAIKHKNAKGHFGGVAYSELCALYFRMCGLLGGMVFGLKPVLEVRSRKDLLND